MKRHLSAILLLMFSTMLYADDLVIIAHRNSGIKKLEHNELVNLYLGRSKKLPSGITALPIDWPPSSEQKKLFYEQLVHKSLSEIQTYWARLFFTGQATPPLQVNTAEEIIDMVTHNEGAIAYIERSKVNSSVTIVYEFNSSSL